MASTIGRSKAPSIVRLVLREADRIPDLAKIWFEDGASPMFAALESAIVRAQERGEIRESDPKVHLASILGPPVVRVLFGEIMGPVGWARSICVASQDNMRTRS